MFHQPLLTETPTRYLTSQRPDIPVQFFAPAALEARHAEFKAGFPGQVTYAVKANASPAVLKILARGGMTAFDVASPAEMALVARVAPSARLHYNNPVRSRDEIATGLRAGVYSWAVDDMGELEKLIAAPLPQGNEVSVRLKLDLGGAAYHFGAKFGATPDAAEALLRRVVAAGLTPAMTFHVGTQCEAPETFAAYVVACAGIARRAGVRLARLNVGGGFPAGRNGQAPDLGSVFSAIRQTMAAFDVAPALVCEPGRALVADSHAHAVRVKSLRGDSVYLNDGIYGGLSEMAVMGAPRVAVLGSKGQRRSGRLSPRIAFGPTCDSLDRLRDPLLLPEDIQDEDWIVFSSMGAYLGGVSTHFNGYGRRRSVIVATLGAQD